MGLTLQANLQARTAIIVQKIVISLSLYIAKLVAFFYSKFSVFSDSNSLIISTFPQVNAVPLPHTELYQYSLKTGTAGGRYNCISDIAAGYCIFFFMYVQKY